MFILFVSEDCHLSAAVFQDILSSIKVIKSDIVK